MSDGTSQNLVVIMGPTGVGKSALAMALAEKMRQPLFYFEPVLAYRELNIGSAKPSAADRRRVAHFGVDITTLARPITLADMYADCVPQIAAQMNRTGTAIVVTGSGFFLRALIAGVPILHQRGPHFIRKETIFESLTGAPYPDQEGAPPMAARMKCYEELARLWPNRARLVHPHDIYRVLRSLEVAVNFFHRYPELKEHDSIEAVGLTSLLPPQARIRLLGVYQNAEVYEARLRARIRTMFDEGWLDEVRDLLARGHLLRGALKSVGYREIYQYLQGTLVLQKDETLQERIFRAHRRLSRKQMRWMGGYSDAMWLNHSLFSIERLVSFIFQSLA